MVSLKAIRAANKDRPRRSYTAVFVGSTSGIGLGTIEALLENTKSSKVYIIGRSRSKFSATLERLQGIDTSAKIIFIEAQVSLLEEVTRVCSIIKAQEKESGAIDLLWLSQGGLSLAGHQLTPEGLNSDLAVKYYSRMLFMQELIPLLGKSSDPRIVSVLSAGAEGSVNTADIGLQDPKNYGFVGSNRQGVAMNSLAMKELSLQNPRIAFIHSNPGPVDTEVHSKLISTMTGYLRPLAWILGWVVFPIVHYFSWTPEEAGQTGFYELTDERYNAEGGRNFFRAWDNAEEVKPLSSLSKYESDGTQKKVWKHTLETFERVLAR
jgi:NAD(P)-dependent dehydrogenase (short-subunit alcohol dehydrogenase family)